MKKIIYLSILTTSILSLFVMAGNHHTATGPGKQIPAFPGTTLPDSILRFVENSCMDCHAADGNSFARHKLNFSVWETYDSTRQAGKAKEICKELSKKSMPPDKWCKNNPDNVPTQANIDMVCRWANSLQK